MGTSEFSIAIREGIAKAPADTILTADVLAAHRLPIPVSRFGTIMKGYPADTQCTQRGEWFLILRGKGGRQ